MALLSFILGILGNITAMLGLVSPMPTFWTIMKKGTTGSFSSQPYLFSLMSALFWTYYGILKKGGIFVVTISAISSAFQVFYLAVYLWFGSQRQRRNTCGILLVIMLSFAAMIVSTMLFEHGGQPLVTVGILCTITSVFSTAAPLTIIHKVVKTGSVEYMPFYLSLGLFLNGSCWLAYALSLKDMFITIPNAIGVTLSSIQLALYAFYKAYGGKGKASMQVVANEKTIAIGQILPHEETLPKIPTHVCSCGAIINLTNTNETSPRTNEAGANVDIATHHVFESPHDQNTNKTDMLPHIDIPSFMIESHQSQNTNNTNILHHIDIPSIMINFPHATTTTLGHSLASPSPIPLQEITISAR